MVWNAFLGLDYRFNFELKIRFNLLNQYHLF
jgi:hypothetical protein